MSAFEDVCWHEAGHGVIAACNGLMTVCILVRENQAETDWNGYRRGTGGAPSSKLNVAAGGMAGQLIGKATTFDDVAPRDLDAARARSDDDRRQYDDLAGGKSQPSFEEKVAGDAWATLMERASLHRALAEELMKYHKVGPLVYAELIMGLTITEQSRQADEAFLMQLEAQKPAPAAPYLRDHILKATEIRRQDS